jgi:parvulin-like peptidyl-prolyl isomerase
MVVEAVALTVNDQVITVSEVLHPVHQQLLAAGKADSVQQFARQAQEIIAGEIQRQIGEALIVTRATEEFSESQMAYVDRMVDERIRDMVLAGGGSKARLEEKIQAAGSTLDAVRKALRRRITTQVYYQLKLATQSGVSRRDLWRHYQENQEQFSQPAKVKMQILAFLYEAYLPDGASVPTAIQRSEAAEQAKAAATAALGRIREGEDFGKVVTEASVSSAFRSRQGGVWDFMAAGSFREAAVEQAAFGMQRGEVSDVIVGETGVFVVKTLDRQDEQVLAFEQVQDQIQQAITEQRHRALGQQYDQELRQRAVIIQAEEFERFAMDRAVGLYFAPGRSQ